MQAAVFLDLDGTLRDWDDAVIGKGLDFAKRHYEAGRVIVIASANHDFAAAFTWLREHFPHPFVGPFCQDVDDGRTGDVFKHDVAHGLEQMGMYRIVGAADDNADVLRMWSGWAVRRDGFDLLRTTYSKRRPVMPMLDRSTVDVEAAWIKGLAMPPVPD